MRIPLFLAWVGLATRCTEGKQQAPLRHTETIRISHDNHTDNEFVEKRKLQQRMGHGSRPEAASSSTRSSHLRPVTNSGDESYGAVEYGGYTYHGGKGKDSKKGGYNDDDSYGPVDYDDEYYGDDDYEEDTTGKGSKGSKGSKGGQGGERGSKKGSKKAKCKKESEVQYESRCAYVPHNFSFSFLAQPKKRILIKSSRPTTTNTTTTG
jgi:hypothetical protein